MRIREFWRLRVPLTPECNLNCLYCYAKNKKDKKAEFANQKKVIKDFIQAPGQEKEIVIFGGEPLLEPKKLNSLVGFLKKEGRFLRKTVKVVLCTNLTVFSLELFKKIDLIYVSLDGTKKSHDRNRIVNLGEKKGSFNIVLNNLKKLSKHKAVFKKLRINKIVSPDNVCFLKKDFDFLEKLKIPFYFSVASAVSGWNKKKLGVLEKELEKIFKKTIDRIEKKELKLLKNLKEFFNLPSAFCPFSSLSLDVDSKLCNCEFLSFINGNKKENKKFTLREAKNKKCIYDLRKEKCLEENCLKCGFICQKIDLSSGKYLKKTEANFLKKAQKNKNFILRRFIEKYQITIPQQIVLLNYNKPRGLEFINTLVWLGRFLKHPPEINIFTDTKEDIKKECKNILPRTNLKQKQMTALSSKKATIVFNCLDGEIFFTNDKGGKKNMIKKTSRLNSIGSLKKGICVLNLKT